MNKPTIILDPHWREMSELFSDSSIENLHNIAEVVWGQDAPIPEDVYRQALPQASVLIAASPQVQQQTLDMAPQLRAVIEVSGAFPDTIDYSACDARGVQVLSCSPGFREPVAEMGLAMAIASARGMINEHEAFRRSEEGWLQDNPDTDFSMYGARVGFVGFGQIARELTRVLAPFNTQIRCYDPWLPQDVADEYGVSLCSLESLAQWTQCLFITAVPTSDNYQLISRQTFSAMQNHSLVILLSRAHLVDFDAMVDEAASGRLRIATDVYPDEPLASDHPLRSMSNVLLSPHRAAAVINGRQLIGRMIVDDLQALFNDNPQRRLVQANTETIAALAAVGDAQQVEDMAAKRE